MAVGFLFVLSLSSGNNDKQGGDSFRSGQAKHSTTITELTDPTIEKSSSDSASKGSGSGWGWSSQKQKGNVDEEVEEEVMEAESKFEKAISEQVSLHQPSISSKIAAVIQSIRLSLDTLLGDSDLVNEEDLADLGNKIEDKLIQQVELVIKEKADDLLVKEDAEMEIQADLETEDMLAGDEEEAEEIIEDLEAEEAKLLAELREGIDDVVGDVKKKIKHMAATITKELLESLLLEKTGSTYKVYLDDEDNVVDFKKRSSSTSTSTSSSKNKSPPSSTHSSSKHKSSSSPNKSSTGSSGHHSSTSTHKSSPSDSTSPVTKAKKTKTKKEPSSDESVDED